MLAIAAAALCLTGLTGTTSASAATAAPRPASTLFAWAPSPLPVAPAPVDLPGGTRLTAITVGSTHSLALASGGRVLAWGVNVGDDLGGNGASSPVLPVAVDMPAGIRVTAVAAGEDFSLALTSGGRVLAWGGDNYGELGNGIVTDPEANPPSPTPMPVHLPARTRVTAIAATGEFALALTSRGRVLAWGDNRDGELGDGSAANSATPVPVHLPARTRVTAIAAGYNYGLALTAAGRVLAWGYNSEDELGDNSACNSSTPVPVDLPTATRVTAIFAAFTHNFALTSDGRLLGWGFNQAGQVGGRQRRKPRQAGSGRAAT
jgi:alpha-tubulin suppressor-like RCC1 family protein